MATDSKKLSDPRETDTEKSKENLPPLDLEEFEGAAEEDLRLSIEDQLATKKMVARRKIEMYWEKKRLREQLGDLEEFDLDF